MYKNEKKALRNIYEAPSGLLSQSDLMSALPERDTRISHTLITSGYIEEVTRRIKTTQVEATFYRLTEKGRMVFEPLYKKIWFWFASDIRTIVVATITAIIVSLIDKLIAK